MRNTIISTVLLLINFANDLICQYDFLDTSFGESGELIIDNAQLDYVTNLYELPDGKILIVGRSGSEFNVDFTVFRLHPDGELDKSFGDEGVVMVDFFGRSDYISHTQILNDGRILLGGVIRGENDQDFGFVRLTEDGSLDHDFGNDGKISFSIFNDSQEKLEDFECLPDGSMIVSSTIIYDQSNQNDICLFRLNADLELDKEFGDNGIIRIDINSREFAGEIFIEDNEIFLTGRTIDYLSFPNKNFAFVAKYDMSGELDIDYGDNGFAMREYSNEYVDLSFSKFIDRSFFISATRKISDNLYRSELFKLNQNLVLSNDFGDNGIYKLPLDNHLIDKDGYVFLENGSILLGAQSTSQLNDNQFVISKITSNGTLDHSFGYNGHIEHPNDKMVSLKSMINTYDGRIITGGSKVNYYASTDIGLYKFYSSVDSIVENDYTPFIMNNAEWIINKGGSGSIVWIKYSTKSDTVINSISYTNLAYKKLCSYQPLTDQTSYFDGPSGIIGGLREEDKRVYYLNYTLEEETLIYDYNFEVGDTVYYSDGYYTVIDSELPDKEGLSGWLVRNSLDWNYPHEDTQLYEGIGSAYGLFWFCICPIQQIGLFQREWGSKDLYGMQCLPFSNQHRRIRTRKYFIPYIPKSC